jgi:fatty-acyl-CoA synthase
MWNHSAHLEAYFGITLAGGVLHTLNLRLHPSDIARIATHAQDRVVIVDKILLPLWEQVAKEFQPQRVILVPDDYEALLASAEKPPDVIQPDENDAVGLCYTSGTTGMPKGVLYSHRSMALHAIVQALPDVMDLRHSDVILPIVPMFHVNAWGLPFAAAMLGIKLVLPGPCLDPSSVLDLFDSERVTFSAGVPTIWMGMLRELEQHPGKWKLHPRLRIMSGGSAVPESMIAAYEKLGIPLIHGWGMTETSPLATLCRLKSTVGDLSEKERLATLAKQGLRLPLVEIRAMNAEGLCPNDGQTMGELEVRGPWVASSYFQSDSESAKWTGDGWFRTGDVATIDTEGYMRITDRTKDLIKSGGEWISSIALENALMSHPHVQEAAVIAIPDAKWQERPLAVVVLKAGADASPEVLRDHLSPRFPKWWLPEKFVFTNEIPRTSTGKFLKTKLRELYGGAAL